MGERAMAIGSADRSAHARRTFWAGAGVGVGGASILVGSLVSWGRVDAGGPSSELVRGTVGGSALLEGKAAVVVGLILLATGGFLVFARTASWRRAALALVVLGSLAVAAIASIDAIRASDRFQAHRIDEVAAGISDTTGLPFDALRDRLASQVRGSVRVVPGAGLLLTLSGAALGVGAGTALLLAADGRGSSG